MIRPPPLALALTLAVILALDATGCSPEVGRGNAGEGGGAGITVAAAASLTDAFTELVAAFGAPVELDFGPSSSLREQLLAGAPADVFAPADRSSMDAVVAAGVASDPRDFATNQLQIVVPAGNRAGVSGLADFADAGRLLGLCAEEVPCGRFARQALSNAGVNPVVDTNEPDVRALLTKVEAGELDAGIVYRSDVLAAGDTVEGVDLPADAGVTTSYPIATLAGSHHPDDAAAFVAYVLSDEGRAILAAHGFGPP